MEIPASTYQKVSPRTTSIRSRRCPGASYLLRKPHSSGYCTPKDGPRSYVLTLVTLGMRWTIAWFAQRPILAGDYATVSFQKRRSFSLRRYPLDTKAEKYCTGQRSPVFFLHLENELPILGSNWFLG